MLRESADSADLIRVVETADVDVTFVEIGQHDTGPLEVRPLLEDPMVFVAPATATEAGQREVAITDIAHLPMIGTRNPGCRQIIDDAFRTAPISPTYVFRSDDTPTIQGLIGAGLAYAVLPLLTVDENDPDVAVIPIRPKPPPRRLGIAWHSERRPPPALLPFVEQLPRSVATSRSSGRRRAPREHRPLTCDTSLAGPPVRRSRGSLPLRRCPARTAHRTRAHNTVSRPPRAGHEHPYGARGHHANRARTPGRRSWRGRDNRSVGRRRQRTVRSPFATERTGAMFGGSPCRARRRQCGRR